jgi:hypothetical protein
MYDEDTFWSHSPWTQHMSLDSLAGYIPLPGIAIAGTARQVAHQALFAPGVRA